MFFEGVEGLLANGIKPEQIGFYRDYNRTELQKCIKEYPSKEVISVFISVHSTKRVIGSVAVG